jgi:hypothetical protein
MMKREEIEMIAAEIKRNADTFISITEEERKLIQENKKKIEEIYSQVADELVEILLKIERARKIIEEAGLTKERAKELIKSVVVEDTGYNEDTVRKVFKAALVHLKHNIPACMIAQVFSKLEESFAEKIEDRKLQLAYLKALCWLEGVFIQVFCKVDELAIETSAGLSPKLVHRLKIAKIEELEKLLKGEVK